MDGLERLLESWMVLEVLVRNNLIMNLSRKATREMGKAVRE